MEATEILKTTIYERDTLYPAEMTSEEISRQIAFAHQYARDMRIEEHLRTATDQIGQGWGMHSALARRSWVMQFADRSWECIICDGRNRNIQLRINEVTVFHSVMGNSLNIDVREILEFHPGPWCDYLEAVVEEAKRRRQLAAINANERERDRLAKAFTPIDL